ncbi:MAG: nucleotidyltransferase family protein [Deltaproteobacteria bacterium]|nr:nucleotidyltransferase family protein [Deltaproteobacteria bacterium]
MKAFILAAGRGERLRPLTDTMPKCLVPVGVEPLLKIWLEICERSGVTDALINLHHLPDKVTDFLKNADTRVKVTTVFEKELLGSAGTLLKNRGFVQGEKDFFIIYADNLTNANLIKMAEFHRRGTEILTMGLFKTGLPMECGIAEADSSGRILSFVEKPLNPASDLASAGIFVSSNAVFDHIPDGFADLGRDVLPKLAGMMQGYLIAGFLMDIGTIERYRLAEREWMKLGGLKDSYARHAVPLQVALRPKGVLA